MEEVWVYLMCNNISLPSHEAESFCWSIGSICENISSQWKNGSSPCNVVAGGCKCHNGIFLGFVHARTRWKGDKLHNARLRANLKASGHLTLLFRELLLCIALELSKAQESTGIEITDKRTCFQNHVQSPHSQECKDIVNSKVPKQE